MKTIYKNIGADPSAEGRRFAEGIDHDIRKYSSRCYWDEKQLACVITQDGPDRGDEPVTCIHIYADDDMLFYPGNDPVSLQPWMKIVYGKGISDHQNIYEYPAFYIDLGIGGRKFIGSLQPLPDFINILSIRDCDTDFTECREKSCGTVSIVNNQTIKNMDDLPAIYRMIEIDGCNNLNDVSGIRFSPDSPLGDLSITLRCCRDLHDIILPGSDNRAGVTLSGMNVSSIVIPDNYRHMSICDCTFDLDVLRFPSGEFKTGPSTRGIYDITFPAYTGRIGDIDLEPLIRRLEKAIRTGDKIPNISLILPTSLWETPGGGWAYDKLTGMESALQERTQRRDVLMIKMMGGSNFH